MKKTKMLAVMLAAMMLMSGCAKSGDTQSDSGKTDAPETSRSEEMQTENDVPDESDAPETEAPATDADETDAPETADNSDKTAVFTAFDKHVFYREDGTADEWNMLEFNKAVLRISSGMYHDSDSEPALFTPEEYVYTGETADLGETVYVKAGDTVGGIKIASANTQLMPPWSEELEGPDINASEGFYPFSSEVKLEGDITLTGIVRYYYDEQYMISSGDIDFIPDASYKGLPMSVDPSGRYPSYGVTDFDVAGSWDESYYGGNVCVYSDAPCFYVGNLNELGSSDTALVELLDGGSANCTKKVEITLTDIVLRYSDQFGTSRASATIKSIKEIG